MKNNLFKIATLFFCLTALVLNSCQEDEMNHSLPVVKVRYYADHLGLGDYSKSEMKYYDEKGNLLFETSHKIKYRGNASFQYSKKSFSFKFNPERSFLSMNSSCYWKLNAEYIDKTFMRNKLSYDLFREFTEGNYAPKVDYVVLYENEKYQGIYAISEGVEEFRLGLNFNDPNAVLFKEPPFHFPPSEHARRYKNFAHYSEVNDRYANFSQKAKKKLIKQSYYNQRYPDVQVNNKKSVVEDVTEFLFNSSDEEFKNKVFTEYFELSNVIDWHLLLLITNNGDGIKKNNYIYRKGTGQPLMYCPWDFDHSFGREGDGEPMTDDICPIESHKLFERLLALNPNNYRKQLFEKFNNLKSGGVLTADHLNEMIDKNAEKIRPEIKANEKQWPLGAVGYFKGSSFEKEVQIMKDWIENHLPRIEQYLVDLQVEEKPHEEEIIPLLVPMHPQVIGSAVEPPDFEPMIVEPPPMIAPPPN